MKSESEADIPGSTAQHGSTSDLKRGMGIWVWSRRPARILESHGDGTYEVEYLDEALNPGSRVVRHALEPMSREERGEHLPPPRLEPDEAQAPHPPRTPLRKFMDEWPLSRAELVKLLEFSPPKVDRLIAEPMLPLDVATLIAVLFNVEVDPAAVEEDDRPHLAAALQAAREGAMSEPDHRP